MHTTWYSFKEISIETTMINFWNQRWISLFSWLLLLSSSKIIHNKFTYLSAGRKFVVSRVTSVSILILSLTDATAGSMTLWTSCWSTWRHRTWILGSSNWHTPWAMRPSKSLPYFCLSWVVWANCCLESFKTFATCSSRAFRTFNLAWLSRFEDWLKEKIIHI